jgi:hypothetical protein
MTTLSAHAEAPNHHTPPACPSNQDATCICGDTLADHQVKDYKTVADLGDRCPDWAGHFTLTGGETLDCPHVDDCTVCGVTICTEHSDEFTTCADSNLEAHHLDCAHQCTSCAETNR